MSSRQRLTRKARALRQAGTQSKTEQEGSKECLTLEERAPTPEHIKKYRQSVVHEPGAVVRHYGMADDKVMAGPFGLTTTRDPADDMKEVMQTFPTTNIMRYELENREKIYASSKREPLGKTYTRGHQLDHIDTFGARIDALRKNKNPESKTLIHPPAAAAGDEDEKVKAQYVKSHGNYDPGEQRKRGYDWNLAKLDPNEHAFGITEERVNEQVAKVLQQEDPTQTTILEKRLEDFRMINIHELGACKKLGHGDRDLPAGHSFGVASRRFDEWGVGDLLKEAHTEDDDGKKDLGRSVRKVFDGDHDPKRVFGAPTIRTDIPAPKSKSVADNNNYGNEPGASTLLYPSSAAERGVVDEDYLFPRSKGELKQFLAACSMDLEEELFESLFKLASQVEGHGPEACSIDAFMTTKKRFDLQYAYSG